MDIRSGLNGLKSLLGAGLSDSSGSVRDNAGQSAAEVTLGADRATLSSAGSEVAQTATDGGVRVDKVAAVQAALAAGNYRVSTTAVAGKMIDAMIDNGRLQGDR